MKLKDYLYYSENGIRLYNGNSLDIMQKLPDNYVDLLATDPPYALKFMGKDWDKTLPSIEIWKECLRVLKPGAFAFIMSAPRQDVLSRMIYNLQEAGFETGFSSIYWTYATGFPKASNIGKMVDKRLGKKREVIGKGKAGAGMNKIKGFGVNTTQGGEPTTEWEVTQGNSLLEGSYGGFQPKPAVEIIIVAMKPLSEKTYVDQALKNGKGITWLDNCRVPYENESDLKKNQREQKYGHTTKFASGKQLGNHINQKGRFPANLIVSNDVLNDGKITKSSKKSKGCGKGGIWHKSVGKPAGDTYGDSGSYSRYFDLDKWWIERVKKLPPGVQKVFPYLIVAKASKKEKNKGLENLPDKSLLKVDKQRGQETMANICPHHKITNCECGWKPKPTKNNHPTVKPIKLMSYLITLGSKEGEVVLDPFMGSGTTGISAKLLNRKFIGIEMNEEYIKIASERIKAWNNKEEVK